MGATHTVTDAASISDGLNALSAHHYELILVDYSLSAEITAHLSLYEIPPAAIIVMITPDECAPALAQRYPSPVDFLMKPFDEPSLKYRIEKNRRHVKGKLLALDVTATLTPTIQHALYIAGYNLSIVESDKLFADAILSERPDMVIVDASLPPLNRDGIIRTLSQHDDILKIAIVDAKLPTDQFRLWTQYGDDFLTKPVSFEELSFRIHRVLPSGISTHTTIPENIVHFKPLVKAAVSPVATDPKSLLGKVYVTLHHEIRSPLTGILIGAQALEKQVTPDQQSVAHEIAESAKKIRDTLDKLAIANNVTSEEYVNGTQMAKFELPATPTFHWI